MSAPKAFQMDAKAQLGDQDDEYAPCVYVLTSFPEDIEDEDGNVTTAEPETRTITAHYPGDANLTLLIAATSVDADDQQSIGQVFAFLSKVFDREDHKYIRQHYSSGEISIRLLIDFLKDMVEEWTTFPTQPRRSSSPSRASTGTRSTVKQQRKPASARSASRPAGS